MSTGASREAYALIEVVVVAVIVAVVVVVAAVVVVVVVVVAVLSFSQGLFRNRMHVLVLRSRSLFWLLGGSSHW